MKAILTDVTKCISCEKCVAACATENKLEAPLPARWTRGDGLSGERFTAVVHENGANVRKQCRHCVEPACASARSGSRSPKIVAWVGHASVQAGCRPCLTRFS